LPVVLHGRETWSLTLKEKRGLRMIENRVLRRLFGPKRDEVTGEWRKLHNEELNGLHCSHNSFRGDQIEKNYMGGACSTYGGEERCKGFLWGSLRARDHLEDPDIVGRIILRWIFKKWDVGIWTGSSWLRIGTVDEHL